MNIVHNNLEGHRPSLKQNDTEDMDNNLHTKRQNKGIWPTTSPFTDLCVI